MKDSKFEVLFRNRSFMAIFRRIDPEPLKCVPAIVNVGKGASKIRVGVFCENHKGRHSVVSEDVADWAGVSNDIIAAWRGTEILQYFNSLDQGLLLTSYYAGVRVIPDPYIQSHADIVISEIGGKYDRVMEKKIPDEIVNLLIWQERVDSLSLRSLIDELEAGMVKWRPEFDEMGVRDLAGIIAEDFSNKRVIKRFEDHIVSYIEGKGLTRNSNQAIEIERTLLKLVEKGVDLIYSEREVVALAAVLSELNLFAPLKSDSKEDGKNSYESIRKALIDEASLWLSSSPRREGSIFRLYKEPSSSGRVLEEMVERYSFAS